MKTTLRQLEIFVGAVEHGSFRACAQAMGLSQVVVSEHIRAMEDRLGVQLFERRAGSRPTLTKAGEDGFQTGRTLLAQYRDFENNLSDSARQRRVRMFAPPFLLRNAAEDLAVLRHAHPGVEIVIDTSPYTLAELVERIETLEADVAFTYSADPVAHPLAETIGEEALAIFVGNDHPLLYKNAVTPQDLSTTPVVHLTHKHPLRPEIGRALSAIGVGETPIALETDEFGLVLSTVSRNAGYVCMFASTADEDGQTAGLRRVDTTVQLPPLNVVALRRPGGRPKSLLSALVELFSS